MKDDLEIMQNCKLDKFLQEHLIESYNMKHDHQEIQ